MPRPPDDCPHEKYTEGPLDDDGVAVATCNECGMVVHTIKEERRDGR